MENNFDTFKFGQRIGGVGGAFWRRAALWDLRGVEFVRISITGYDQFLGEALNWREIFN